MADPIPSGDREKYSRYIDEILKGVDLEQISARAIRNALQERLGYDVSGQKTEITALIMERFDKAQAQVEKIAPSSPAPAPITNGHAKPTNGQTAQKRKAESSPSDSDLSDIADAPAPKKVKKVKKPEVESDEAFAAKLQAQFNAQDRPTRGGAVQKKRATVKKEKKTKKKSAATVGSDLDSDVEGSGEVKEKKGAFHKPYTLSEPLAALLGETVLSRPQTVKKIWAYVKENNVQDPADGRQFICTPAMRAVFQKDRIHMFTMNKMLGDHLYPVESV